VNAIDKLERIEELVSHNGCDCDCECIDLHGNHIHPDCEPCLACRIDEALKGGRPTSVSESARSLATLADYIAKDRGWSITEAAKTSKCHPLLVDLLAKGLEK
jgi:hypothetical protein